MLFQSIPIDLTIIAGAKDVQVYSDEAATQPLVALHFGEASQGATRVFSMYAKNEGDITTEVVATIVGDVSWGTVIMTPDIMSTPISLAPDEVSEELVLSVTPNEDAALEYHSFELEFSDGA